MLKVTEREISLLRVCNHPNIIELLQVIETPKVILRSFARLSQKMIMIVVF